MRHSGHSSHSSKKMRKRDILIYVGILIAVLALVIGLTKLIEHFNEVRFSYYYEDEEYPEEGQYSGGEVILDESDVNMPQDEGKPTEAVSETELTSTSHTGLYNSNIKNILLIGVDKYELKEEDLFRRAGQSDVIMVLSMNMKTKEYFIVTINRDLAVPVENYSTIGESYGFVTEQIALSYAYGDGTRLSGRNTMKSVNLLLGDIPFLGYVAAPISIISTLADAVDGVPVLIEDDFTGVDDTLIQGEVAVLRGAHAETFCRARKAMKNDPYNEFRMTRQLAFATSFMDRAKSTLSAKQAVKLYDKMTDIIQTDMGKSDITKWIANAYDYEFKGFYRIDGEYGEMMHDAPSMVVDYDQVNELVQELYYK